MVLRHLYIWPRSPERFMWTFGWPLFGLIIWGLTISFLQSNSLSTFSFITFIMSGIIFWEMVVQPQREISINFIDEMWNKNFLNIFSSPLTNAEYLTALVIIGIFKMFATLISLTLGAVILYQFNIFATFGFFVPALFINLLLFGMALGFIVNALILRFGWSMQEMAWAIVAIIQPLACVLYPLTALPEWVQRISLMLPPTYVFEEMRRIMSVGSVNFTNLFISFFMNVAYLVFSLLFFKLMYEHARVHGRLIKIS